MGPTLAYRLELLLRRRHRALLLKAACAVLLITVFLVGATREAPILRAAASSTAVAK
jgi:hypothetical protein